MANGSDRILPVSMEDEMRNSYLDYSMSVIVARALPDVRDGLKPVHRRILFGMEQLSLAPNKAYKKSARIVGEVLGKYHPHGDTAVYDSMVRMAQQWSLRYPLVDGQGNFGSVDGDSPAAMRYTEARMAPVAMEVLRDLDKNTVDFRTNFDETLEEPTVLPTIAPLLLVNGSNGIAVGMATNIPPHNLKEVVNGILALIENPDLTIPELMRYITAPDFPTGGIIYGYAGVKEAYETGRGRLRVRAKTTIEENEGSRDAIIVTELPYQVNKANLIEKVAELVREKKLEDIADLRDESDRDGMRIVFELKRDSMPMVALNNLFKHTQMQTTFGVIMLALVDGRPRILNLRETLQHFIEFRNEVIIRRTQFELDAAERRAHILEGYLIALDNIDEVIQIIRSSQDPATANSRLQERFQLTEVQAKAILDMRLQRLTGLEREKIEEEYRDLLQTIERLKAILGSKELQMQEIAKELRYLRDKFDDERRTEIVYNAPGFTMEDMIADEDVIVSITHNGFIKRTAASQYRRQSRGGRGASGVGTREDDYVEFVFQTSTHHFLLFFTDKGRCFRIKVYDLPEGSRISKGRSIANVILKESDEKVTAFLPVEEFDGEHYIMMTTKYGVTKKTPLSSFANVRVTGIIAVNLNEGDRLIDARLTDGANDIIIATKKGMACRFHESDVRAMGRTAAGVRGILLSEGDEVVSMVALRPEDTVMVVSEHGYGKRGRVEDYRLTRRGAKGVISMNLSDKTGDVVGLLHVCDDEDIVVITTKGVLIRQAVSQTRVMGRNTQGVRLIRLDSNDLIADVTRVAHEEEEEEDEDGTNGQSPDAETMTVRNGVPIDNVGPIDAAGDLPANGSDESNGSEAEDGDQDEE